LRCSSGAEALALGQRHIVGGDVILEIDEGLCRRARATSASPQSFVIDRRRRLDACGEARVFCGDASRRMAAPGIRRARTGRWRRRQRSGPAAARRAGRPPTCHSTWARRQGDRSGQVRIETPDIASVSALIVSLPRRVRTVIVRNRGVARVATTSPPRMTRKPAHCAFRLSERRHGYRHCGDATPRARSALAVRQPSSLFVRSRHFSGPAAREAVEIAAHRASHHIPGRSLPAKTIAVDGAGGEDGALATIAPQALPG